MYFYLETKIVRDSPRDIELVGEVHEEELEPALHHLLVVARLAGVKQLPALLLVEILGGRVQISLHRVMVVSCLKALLATAITRPPLMPLSSDSSSPCGISVAPCGNSVAPCDITVAPCGSAMAPCCGNVAAFCHYLLLLGLFTLCREH